LFDLSGYRAIADKLAPDDVKEITGRIFGEIAAVFDRYEGVVEKYFGNAVMGLLCARMALEDASQRAIRSALSIHKEITRFSERMAQKKRIPPIRTRAGIRSVPVVVGTAGNNLSGVQGPWVHGQPCLPHGVTPGAWNDPRYRGYLQADRGAVPVRASAGAGDQGKGKTGQRLQDHCPQYTQNTIGCQCSEGSYATGSSGQEV